MPTARPSAAWGSALVLLSAAGFGLAPLFATRAYDAGISVPSLLFLRFGLAAAALFAYLALRGTLPRRTARELAGLALLGVLYAMVALGYFTALKHVSPALAVLLLYLYPAFVALSGRDRLLGAVAVSMAGMVLVVGKPGGASLLGIGCAAGAAVVYAAYILAGNKLAAAIPPLETTAYVALVSAVVFAGLGLGRGDLDLGFGLASWADVLAVSFLATVLAIGCFFAGMRSLGPTRASILSMAEPVIGILAAWLFLGSTLNAVQLLGGAIVLAGAAWGILGRPARQPALDG
ncbi:EamA family transporter [Longispora albida]|uniref:EamA family transporter n=1 Tax=Longispora albida TaxID=203523 RepID=UPI000375A77E|nr:DMT family transporter [Longispora albida]